MQSMSRSLGVTIGLVASALTITGVVLAASDPNPSGKPLRDPLELNGYPPTSVGIGLSVSSDSQFSVQGEIDYNFANDTASAQLQIPLALSSAVFAIRAVDGHVFAYNANLNSANHINWYDEPLKWPSLYGGALELTKPDISFITGFPTHSVTHHGYYTTYTFARQGITVTPLSAHRAHSTLGNETWTITTGAQGEVTGSSLTIRTAHAFTTITATVLWYNHRVTVVAPPRTDWTPVPKALIASVRRTQLLQDFVIPTSIFTLGTAGSIA
jgi:hypothetical protein